MAANARKLRAHGPGPGENDEERDDPDTLPTSPDKQDDPLDDAPPTLLAARVSARALVQARSLPPGA